MANKKIINVDSSTNLTTVFGRENGSDIKQATTDSMKVGGLSAATPFTGEVSPVLNRAIIDFTKIYVLGDFVWFFIKFHTNNFAWDNDQAYAIFSGLPAPDIASDSYFVPFPVTVMSDSGAWNAIECKMAKNGTCYFQHSQSSAITYDINLGVSGFYKKA